MLRTLEINTSILDTLCIIWSAAFLICASWQVYRVSGW